MKRQAVKAMLGLAVVSVLGMTAPAVSAAETAKVLGGFDPRVAILSFSTKGSAKHEMVDKVIELQRLPKKWLRSWLSTANFKPMQPSCLQWARARLRKATSPALPTCLYSHRSKWATSPTNSCSDSAVHRQVVLSCKAWQSRSNDLSRGCSWEDIYKTVIITCNQSIIANQK